MWNLPKEAGNAIHSVALSQGNDSLTREADAVSARKRVFLLMALLVVSCGAVGGTSLWLLYNAAFQEESLRLREMAVSRAQQIQAVANHLRQSGGAEAASESAVFDAILEIQSDSLLTAPDSHSAAVRNVGYKSGSSMKVLSFDAVTGGVTHTEVNLSSDLGTPMRKALDGESGVMVGVDSKGAMVLAAYEPVESLPLGVVAKIPLAEVRAPFLNAALIAGLVGLLVMGLGVILFTRITNPVIRRLASTAASLRATRDRYQRMFTGPSTPMLLLDPATGRIVEANPAAARFYGPDKESLRDASLATFTPMATGELIPVLGKLESGQIASLELTQRTASGEMHQVEISATPIEVDGRLALYCVINDVTQRKQAEQEREAQDWLKTGLSRFNDAVRGEQTLQALCHASVRELATYLEASVGALFAMDSKAPTGSLILCGTYAYSMRKNLSARFELGEGVVGQAALEKQTIVIRNVPDDYVRIVSGTGESIPHFIVVSPIVRDGHVKGVVELGFLGELTRLQTQYLEQCLAALGILMDAVTSREALASALVQSQQLSEELQTQQEELRATNEELEAQTRALLHSEQKLKSQQEELQATNEELSEKTKLLEHQKREVEAARAAVEAKVKDLDQANRYKSQFLANMSHELRTPLNSLLLLSQVMGENKGGNLTSEQIESIQMIHGSGQDLLNLINDILDLARIEAGRTETTFEQVTLADVVVRLSGMFKAAADAKGLVYQVSMDAGLPEQIVTDPRRLEQILRNLVANAVKFTEQGEVTVRVGLPESGVTLPLPSLRPESTLAVTVRDTGIGISEEHQKIVFEAFQQADGGINRKFGGSGLGLAISRELARLLGGDITLKSKPGEGACFTLYLPMKGVATEQPEQEVTMLDKPIVSVEPHPTKATQLAGKQVLVVEDGAVERAEIMRLLAQAQISAEEATTGAGAIDALAARRYDCLILDLTLPDMSGLEVLRTAAEAGAELPPVVVHTCRDVTREEEAALREFTDAIVLKGHSSAARLLDEVRLMLHKLAGPPRDRQKPPLTRLQGEDEVLKGKKVLVADDDMRTAFAVSRLLAAHGMKTVKAEDGRKALEVLAQHSDIDLVLMDVMMPVMDGLTAIREIRSNEAWRRLPILVLTAKAMKGDREQCLECGANDYLPKPLDPERLLSMMRVWLYKA